GGEGDAVDAFQIGVLAPGLELALAPGELEDAAVLRVGRVHAAVLCDGDVVAHRTRGRKGVTRTKLTGRQVERDELRHGTRHGRHRRSGSARRADRQAGKFSSGLIPQCAASWRSRSISSRPRYRRTPTCTRYSSGMLTTAASIL